MELLPDFQSAIQRAHVTDNGDAHASDGGEKQMIGAATFQVEGEATLGNFAAEEGVADLEMIELGSEVALGHQFDEKFEGPSSYGEETME